MDEFAKKIFSIAVKVAAPILIGQDEKTGRRQLIPITEGHLEGKNMTGEVMPGGIDAQVIRPDGVCEVSARYGVQMADGSSFYVENNGIRTVPDEYVKEVKAGKFISPELYYFCTKPEFEVFGESLQWMTKTQFICKATRLPDQVLLDYFQIL